MAAEQTLQMGGSGQPGSFADPEQRQRRRGRTVVRDDSRPPIKRSGPTGSRHPPCRPPSWRRSLRYAPSPLWEKSLPP